MRAVAPEGIRQSPEHREPDGHGTAEGARIRIRDHRQQAPASSLAGEVGEHLLCGGPRDFPAGLGQHHGMQLVEREITRNAHEKARWRLGRIHHEIQNGLGIERYPGIGRGRAVVGNLRKAIRIGKDAFNQMNVSGAREADQTVVPVASTQAVLALFLQMGFPAPAAKLVSK